MSKCKKDTIKCPKCGREIEIDVWENIDLPYDAEQKKRVLKNSLFKVNCADCRIIFPIAYRCQYNDMERKYLIWFAPRAEETERKAIAAYNQKLKTDKPLQLAQGGYRYRIVFNDNELREKVLIFDEGLDDRYIETMKISYLPLLQKNLTEDEAKILGIYFDKKEDGKYRWVIVFDRKQAVAVDIDMNMYEDMKIKLKDIVEEKTPEGLAQISAHWAWSVMQAKVAENQPENENKE